MASSNFHLLIVLLFVTISKCLTGDFNAAELKSQDSIRKIFAGGILSHLALGEDFEVKDSMECFNDFMKIKDDLQHSNTSGYVLKMLDAEGKPPSGIMNGNIFWPGEYNECLSVKSSISNGSSRGFRGRYCFLHLSVHFSKMASVPLQVGVCVPDSCGDSEVELASILAIPQILSFSKKLGITADVKVVSAKCEEKEEISTGGKVMISILVIFLSTTIIATVLDIFINSLTASTLNIQTSTVDTHGESTEISWLLGRESVRGKEQNARHFCCMKYVKRCTAVLDFSLRKNYRELMSQTKKDGHLSCLDGLRVISMWWIILGHSYVAMTYAVSNLLEVTTIVKRISFQAILASSFAVDTFFFLSGLLMTFVTLRRIELNDGKMKWYLFIIHRILRLTPVYAVVLFTYTYLTAYAAKGPLGLYLKQNDFFKIVSLCKTKWWTNLLYINNFYPHNGDFVNVCMPWSWYLAADVQFYVISPIFLILLYRYRNIALSVIVSLIIGSMFVRGFIISEYNINFFREMTSAILYIKPYTRISSFLIGALLGYALQHETYLWQPKKIFVFFGWIMAFTLMALVVYGPHHYYLDLDNASSTASLFYGTFCRTTWCLALAWIVFACATGHGGPVQQFLSFRIWEPLGRLTYCAYLVHPIIIFGHLVLAGDIRHYTDIAMAWIYIGNLVVTYSVAFIFYLVVEAPVAGIEKRMLKCCNRSSTTGRELPRNDVNQLL